MLLPCSFTDLAAAGIGEVEVGQLRLEREAGRVTVRGAMVRRHAGVVLSTELRPLEGQALREAAAGLVAEGRWLRGARDRLEQALFLRDLLHQLASLEGGTVATPELVGIEAWVLARLEDVGLERCEDLELVAVGDLVPDLDALAGELGLDPRSPEQLAADFSPSWTHLDGRYRVEVRLAARRVLLRPDDARAKKVGEPPARQLPRWRGFSVTFVQASRKLRLR